MSTYSLSVYCPRCGRTEDGIMATEAIVCAACGTEITSWSRTDEENYDDTDDEGL